MIDVISVILHGSEFLTIGGVGIEFNRTSHILWWASIYFDPKSVK